MVEFYILFFLGKVFRGRGWVGGGSGLPYGWGVNACELAFNLMLWPFGEITTLFTLFKKGGGARWKVLNEPLKRY